MHSCRLHGAEIHSTRVLFCIIDQSDYDPGRDRTRAQWYRSCTPYHKATAAVGVVGELGTFILYIFIPRSVAPVVILGFSLIDNPNDQYIESLSSYFPYSRGAQVQIWVSIVTPVKILGFSVMCHSNRPCPNTPPGKTGDITSHPRPDPWDDH